MGGIVFVRDIIPLEPQASENIQMIAKININVADIRAEPRFQSERTSQALFNEIVEILDEKDDYQYVKTGDAYEGWIAGQFLSQCGENPEENPYLVISNLAPGYQEPDNGSKRVVSVPYGCKLSGDTESGYLRIQSERYGTFYIHSRDFINNSGAEKSLSLDKDTLLKEAEKFLGAPYLWGGRSFFGIDCSGFVQTIVRRFGVELPRDTKDQINSGREVERNQIRLGDLLFFPRHVAMAITKTDFIHSSSSNGGVAFNSLDSKINLYNRYLDESFKTARRIFG
jgi:hypothetical protein